ncbi:MAG: Ig-like domain-containing protein [Neisseria sp.]|nr:Ig-like domain-containing protein [Neisseria sp.]
MSTAKPEWPPSLRAKQLAPHRPQDKTAGAQAADELTPEQIALLEKLLHEREDEETVALEQDSPYQLLAVNGEVELVPINQQNNDEAGAVIIHDTPLIPTNAAGNEALLAAEASTPATSGKINPVVWIGAGLLAVGAAAAGGGGGGGGGSEKSVPAVSGIVLDKISGDNVINAAEKAAGKITLSGSVSGSAPAGKAVIIKINGQTVGETTVAADKTFRIDIDGSQLSGSQGSITATVDDFSSSQNYSVKTTLQATIDLNPITADNILNATEAAGTVNVSGKVTVDGKTAPNADTVIINLNGKTYSGKLAQGVFSIAIAGAELAKSTSLIATVSAGDAYGNRTTATDSHTYQVKTALPTATLTPDAITGDNAVSNAEAAGNITLSGSLSGNFDGSWITATVGGASHRGLVVNGQYTIRDIPGKLFVQDSDGKVDYSVALKDAYGNTSTIKHSQNYTLDPTLETLTLTLDPVADGLIDVTELNGSVNIGGKVEGAFTAGNTVRLSINGKTHTATVQSDGRFSTAVKAGELAADADHTITADIALNRPSGTLSAHDSARYAAVTSVSGADKEIAAAHAETYNPTVPVSDADAPYFIQALNWLNSGSGFLLQNNQWGSAWQGKGHGIEITYSFATASDTTDQNGKEVLASTLEGFRPFSAQQQSDIAAALKMFGEMADITFTPAKTGERGKMVIYLEGLAGEGANVWGYFRSDGELHLNSGYMNTNDAFSASRYFPGYGYGVGFHTVIHEVGHALGLKHPFEGTETLKGPKDSTSSENNTEYTVMAYEGLSHTELGIFDLAALHFLYGVNTKVRSGDNTYTFNDQTLRNKEMGVYIWDGGGNDTFDASTATQGVTLNLTPGSWNHIGTKGSHLLYTPDGTRVTNQSFIGYGTQIETAIGSAHADTLTGNKADNILYGGAGNDILNDDLGNDRLDGGAGADQMSGGRGHDTYFVNDIGDQVRESLNQGSDTVYSSISYTLGENLENLRLYGNGAINGTGNDADNLLYGNHLNNVLNGGGGRDVLNGGGGKDTLTGGAGDDLFVFDGALRGDNIDVITDFSGGDKIVLSDLVFAGIRGTGSKIADGFTNLLQDSGNQFTFSANTLQAAQFASGKTATSADSRILYDQADGTLWYDRDGNGAATPIQFATLSNHAELSAASFIVA